MTVRVFLMSRESYNQGAFSGDDEHPCIESGAQWIDPPETDTLYGVVISSQMVSEGCWNKDFDSWEEAQGGVTAVLQALAEGDE